MMFMTAKVDLKKILIILAVIAGVILGAVWLLGGEEDVSTGGTAVSNNEERVKFLEDRGWQVAASPVETSRVKIPKESSEVFTRYNNLQKSQGFDLTPYAGKNVMRYVYKITNYPGSTEPVYATLLVYKNQVIGGDVTDTAARGKIRGLTMPEPESGKSSQPEQSANTTPILP